MYWRLMITLVLGLSLTTFGCDDDDAGDNGLSFSGSNGFMIDGDGLSRVSVNCSNNSGTTTESSAIGFTVYATVVELNGEHEGYDVEVSIEFSSQTGALGTGEKQAGVSASGSLLVSVIIDGKTYRSKNGFADGEVTVNYTNVGDRLQGSYEGTLQNGDASVKVFGKFDVENQRD